MRFFRGVLAGGLAVASTIGVVAYVQAAKATLPTVQASARVRAFDQVSATYLLRRDQQVLGVSKLSYATLGRDTLEVMEDVRLRVPVPGGSYEEVRQNSTVRLDGQLQVLSFEITIESRRKGRTDATQKTELRARRLDEERVRLYVRTGTRTEADSLDRPIPRGFIIGQSLWPRLALSGVLLVGNRFEVSDFDPVSLRFRPIRISIVSKDSVRRESLADHAPEDSRRGWVSVYTVSEESQGLRSTTRVRADGLPLSASLAAGITMELVTPESMKPILEAWAQDRLVSPADTLPLIAATAIRAGAPAGDRARFARMRLRLNGMDSLDLAALDLRGGVQSWSPAQRTVDILAGQLRRRSARAGEQATPADTAPEPFIQSDAPEIRSLVAEVLRPLGPNADAQTKVITLTAHVWRRLEKAYSGGVPDAVETLASGAGDCTEHTVLATALLRAAGIPARPVTGLAYVQGSWFFHAWVEVNLGQGWEPVDPTFGEAPASAGRLRLFIGRDGLSRIAPLVGRLQLVVLDAQAAPSSPAAASSAPVPTDPAGRPSVPPSVSRDSSSLSQR